MQIEFILELTREKENNRLHLSISVGELVIPEYGKDKKFLNENIHDLFGENIFKATENYIPILTFKNETGIENLQITEIDYSNQTCQKHLYFYTIDLKLQHPNFGILNFFFYDNNNDMGDGIEFCEIGELKNYTQTFKQVLSFSEIYPY